MNPPITPNFFIVGAARSGTTSLVDSLNQHPDVFIPVVRAPNYFLPDTGIDDWEAYLSLFKGAGAAHAVGEASTEYLFDEGAPGRIHGRFPDAKIVIILRNPVEMAYSLWRYMVVTGSEAKDFAEAIGDRERNYRMSQEFKRSCEGYWASYLYVERARYSGQVKRWIDTFGAARVRIYIFEAFVRNPVEICQDLYEFLGVDRSFVPDCRVLNESGDLRFSVFKSMRRTLYPVVRDLIPLPLRTRLAVYFKALMTAKGNRTGLDPVVRMELGELFREDIAGLESLLGRTIDDWM